MDYYSMLFEGEKGTFVRKDYCVACGKGLAKQEGILSAWKGVVPERKKEVQPLSRNEKALELLRAALEHEGEEERQEAFVLALYLARNRFLLARKDLSPEIALYEVAATEEMLAVRKVPLTTLAVSHVQQKLAQKFAHASLPA
jgi:hypothetical protein